MMPCMFAQVQQAQEAAHAKSSLKRAEDEKKAAEEAYRAANLAGQEAGNKEIAARAVADSIDKLSIELIEMQQANELLSQAFIENGNIATALYTPEIAYSYYQASIKKLLGMPDGNYLDLTESQRLVVNNNLLTLTKQLYDNSNKPAFLLYDFAILYDANLWLGSNLNSELLLALNNHINKQINYLAGYATLQSTSPSQFVAWAETAASQQDCAFAKVLGTYFYELSENSNLQQELTTKIILESVIDSKDVLEECGGISNGLRNAALCDGGSLDKEYKDSLEKSCTAILDGYNGRENFIAQLNSSELGKILVPIKQRDALQKSCTLERARLEAFNNAYRNKYFEYVALIDNYNQIVREYNIAAAAANAAYAKSAQHQANSNHWQACSEMHSLSSQMHGQDIVGTSPATRNVNFSVNIDSRDGFTFIHSDTIQRGSNIIATAAYTYNGYIATGEKINATLAAGQARRNAIDAPIVFSEPKALFTDEFGMSMIEDTLSSNRETTLQQLTVTPVSNNFTAEPDSSFWNIAVDNLKQDWQPLTDRVNRDSSLWYRFVDGVNSGMYSALSYLTGSGAADASPLVAGGVFANPASVAPIIANDNKSSIPPTTFKQLGIELLDAGKKTLLLTSVLANPAASIQDVYQILATPMHELNPKDLLLPGGNNANIDTTIPAYEAQGQDVDDAHTGHSNNVPGVEDIILPPYTSYDGDPLLFMFKGNGYLNSIKDWSIKGRVKAAKLPTEGKIRFVPREDYDSYNHLPRGPNNGYYDRFGNEWVKGPSRTPGEPFEWDVQLSELGKIHLGWASRDGKHINVSLKGEITHR